jgi:DNA helicase-2/ATP-dependent DNA helicase PcrA
MTMHNAKGLEFPVVFVAGCEEGLLPHASSVDDSQVEEERRLFYVALTRAMHQVVLTAASTRRRFGVLEAMLPSRFLHEIPSECLLEAPPWSTARTAAPAARRSLSSAAADGDTIDAAATGMWSVDTFRRSQARRRAGRARAGRAAEDGAGGFAAHELNQEEVHFAPGMRVRHELLGEGTVEQVEGSGELTKLTVKFGDAGRKRLLARFASLAIIEGS